MALGFPVMIVPVFKDGDVPAIALRFLPAAEYLAIECAVMNSGAAHDSRHRHRCRDLHYSSLGDVPSPTMMDGSPITKSLQQLLFCR